MGYRVILNYGELDGLKFMKYYLLDNVNLKLVIISWKVDYKVEREFIIYWFFGRCSRCWFIC